MERREQGGLCPRSGHRCPFYQSRQGGREAGGQGHQMERETAILQPPGLEGEKGWIRKSFGEAGGLDYDPANSNPSPVSPPTTTTTAPPREQDGHFNKKEWSVTHSGNGTSECPPTQVAKSILAPLALPSLTPRTLIVPVTPLKPSVQNVLPSLPWEGPLLGRGTACT